MSPRAVRPHRVVVLALDSVVPLDLSAPCQVFGYGGAVPERWRYSLVVCAAAARRSRDSRRLYVSTANGFSIATTQGLEAVRRAETVVVPGIANLDTPVSPAVCVALREAYARGARVVSICTGAFVLAAAGLLDGRRATTHWADAQRLAEQYPRVRVIPDVLYVDEGQILTSAGVAAGIDLCLHIVRRDYGAEAANTVARRLVVAPHRSGGQAQYAEHPVANESSGGLERTRAWMLARLENSLTVGAMAAHARLSRRTFARHFVAETGTSPLRWLLDQRVLCARRLLETTRAPIERVATRCGFGSSVTLRLHFRRATGVSPTAYRRTFRGDER